VTPLRSTVAGNYSATLSFFGDDLTYYVAISQQNTYWRVITTQNKKRADAIYADFVAQAERLAAAQERSAELAAQEVATQRLIEQAQIKAQQLQADAQIAQTQRDEVATQQAQAAEQVKNLKAEDQDARKKLSQIRHQVVGLQIASNFGLPPEHPARLHKTKKHAQHTKIAALTTAQ
jgi:chromosome segregation ATPase